MKEMLISNMQLREDLIKQT